MKKLLAIIIVCMCSINVSIAQNQNGKQNKRHQPRFLMLDSTSRSNTMKDRRNSWEKFKHENEKKWKKHIATWHHPHMGFGKTVSLCFTEGKSLATFDVNNDGATGNVKAYESADPILNNELVSKLKTMPNWIPARQNGRTIKDKYTFPVTFVALS